MQTRAARTDRPAIDLRRLVAGFLRMAPDVAIVGEVRDREALPLLLTLSSGVKGFTTIHAGSARQALTRLRFLAQLSDAARELPLAALNTLVSEAVDLVVHSERGPQRAPGHRDPRRRGPARPGRTSVQFTVTDVFARQGVDGPLAWTGLLPLRAGEPLLPLGHGHPLAPRTVGHPVTSLLLATLAAVGTFLLVVPARRDDEGRTAAGRRPPPHTAGPPPHSARPGWSPSPPVSSS